ncbi:MAG TPA: hypothetical protein VMN37_05485 [Gemmatimonadales bacterium]|nr:hypothetical protein [Gemmatimonadales bacterium]
MADASSGRVRLRDVVIVGGGCYGSFYAGQLARARRKGQVEYRRVLVVDRDPDCRAARDPDPAPDRELVRRDWTGFFDDWLGAATPQPPDEPPDAIVPSPLMPHLMYEWLARRARTRWPERTVERRALPFGPGTPYDVAAPDHTRYVSFADWLCPVHCIEPAICPVIRGPRTWEMSDAMERLTARLALAGPTEGPVLFVCRHRVYGVGMFDVAAVLAGDETVARAGAAYRSVDIVVGTISACHGAAALLHLGP